MANSWAGASGAARVARQTLAVYQVIAVFAPITARSGRAGRALIRTRDTVSAYQVVPFSALNAVVGSVFAHVALFVARFASAVVQVSSGVDITSIAIGQ